MTIKIYTRYSDMSGIGIEWYVDSKQNVLIKFYNGNFERRIVEREGNDETTVIN